MIYLIVYIIYKFIFVLYHIIVLQNLKRHSRIFLELQKQVKNEVITFIHLFI